MQRISSSLPRKESPLCHCGPGLDAGVRSCRRGFDCFLVGVWLVAGDQRPWLHATVPQQRYSGLVSRHLLCCVLMVTDTMAQRSMLCLHRLRGATVYPAHGSVE